MTLTIRGSLPWAMAENSGPGDWLGALALSGDQGDIVAVSAIGPAADFFALAWDIAAGTLSVTPGAAADYESFQDPLLQFSLRVTYRGGRLEDAPTPFGIALLDRDDTPPQALGFASGGSVVAGAIGAVIGQLDVTDPDTAAKSGFFFSLLLDDDWRFEITADGTLKLRDGISLGLDDMPLRSLLVTVSDGTQAAAFDLGIAVTDPSAPPPVSPVLDVGESRGSLALPEPERAVVLGTAESLLGLTDPGDSTHAIQLAGEAAAALPGTVRQIDFLDARLELDTASPAAVARILAGSAATAAPAAGVPLVALAPAMQAATPEGIVTGLYQAIAGRVPTPVELELGLGRLGSGTTAAQIAVDLAAEVAAAAGPVWLPVAQDLALPASLPAIGTGSVPAALPPALDLLIG